MYAPYPVSVIFLKHWTELQLGVVYCKVHWLNFFTKLDLGVTTSPVPDFLSIYLYQINILSNTLL